MQTFEIPSERIAAMIEALRKAGGTDDEAGQLFVELSNFEMTQGVGAVELETLRAKLPAGSVQIVAWIAIHPKLIEGFTNA